MAAGYSLTSGEYRQESVSDDELWAALSSLFSNKTKNTSSYKYGLLKVIIDNLYNVDERLVLSFDQVFSKFSEIYWNLTLKYHLKQSSGTTSKIEQILLTAKQFYSIPDDVPYESISADIMEEIAKQTKKQCSRYVIGAFYEDTKQLFYSFSKREQRIQINPRMYQFVCKHKILIEKLNYYEWARFLEKINSDNNSIHILAKLDESAKRMDLSFYRHILFEEFEYQTCFYCGRKVTPHSSDIDHFIPWSFIKDDNLWNLVVSCSTCNRKKNDNLATRPFLKKIIIRNRELIPRCNSDKTFYYSEENLTNVYRWAEINGYSSVWEPNNVNLDFISE